MDGMEATQHIRALEDRVKSTIPIVALTANALKGDSEKYMAVGMNDYLSKPFDESRLFMVISNNIDSRAKEVPAAIAVPEQAKPDAGKLRSNAEMAKIPPSASQTSVAHPEEKLYNLAMVEAISGGDQEFVKRMLQLFLDTMPEALRDMRACVQHERWEALGKLAHKLKSTIDSMGITQLKQVVRNIENNGKAGSNMEEMPAIVDKLIDIMQACMMQVKKDFSL